MIRIEQGLFSHMVLQRNARNVCEVSVSGTCESGGILTAAVLKGRKPVQGCSRLVLAKSARGRFAGTLKGIPVGGPYTMTVALEDRAGKVLSRQAVNDVWVGDVWLCGGQSNMQGCGQLAYAAKPVSAVRAFFMSDEWGVARDPIHNMWACVDPVHADLCGGHRPPRPKLLPTDGVVGPSVAFGQALWKATGIPQGLIACGHGGTSMAQWSPSLKKEGGKSLYGAMLRRFVKNGARAAGLIWYQGCSDAGAEAAPVYTDNMKRFVTALRRDTRHLSLPVAMVQISRVIEWGREDWNSIQEQQRQLPKRIKGLAVVPSIDLELDDGIHLGRDSHRVLGRRLAQAMRVLCGDRKAGPPPISLRKLELTTHRGCATVVATFDHVAGMLVAPGRPVGFQVVSSKGQDCVYNVELRGHQALIRTTVGLKDMDIRAVHYGYGINPVCNISDEKGRSLPVFGPQYFGRQRPRVVDVQHLRVSDPMPCTGRIEALAYPEMLDPHILPERVFPTPFCTVMSELSCKPPLGMITYSWCRVSCGEAMKLQLHLGFDGPLKVWIDRKEVFCDPAGEKPANPFDAGVPFGAGAGDHEILMALQSPFAETWGVFLRMERLDPPESMRVPGPGRFALPTISV